jgi:hypothetical protein
MLRIGATALATIMVLTACSSSPAGTAGPGATGTPRAASTPATPSGTQPPLTIPSIPIPSFSSDTDLAARFPTVIDGQPVSAPQTVKFGEFLQLLAQQPAQITAFEARLAEVGLDINTISYGSANATVDDETVQIQALRTAGADAAQFMQAFEALNELFSPDDPLPTLTQSTIGGKNITLSTDEDGDVTYIYISGDVLWLVENADESSAATILAALS